MHARGSKKKHMKKHNVDRLFRIDLFETTDSTPDTFPDNSENNFTVPNLTNCTYST